MFTVLGGKLGPEISLSIIGQVPVSTEKCLQNIEHTRSLAFPKYRKGEAEGKSLAVIGGGPSAKEHLSDFGQYDEIWAINGMYGFLKERGIESTLIAIDPHPIVKQWATGAHKALIASVCDPVVFDVIDDIRVFELGSDIRSGSSTATCCPDLAFKMGYGSITFYGCESSYVPDNSHAYMHEPREEEMVVLCGGKYYLTAPDFYMQACELSKCIRAIPGYLKEQSGGLLRAMVEDEKHHVVWVSDGMVKTMGKA